MVGKGLTYTGSTMEIQNGIAKVYLRFSIMVPLEITDFRDDGTSGNYEYDVDIDLDVKDEIFDVKSEIHVEPSREEVLALVHWIQHGETSGK